MIKPILFNTDMVRAILEDRKTVTRRVVKLKYSNTHLEMRTDKYGTRLIEIENEIPGVTRVKNPDGTITLKLRAFIDKTPSYRTGDILYVRETFSECAEGYAYSADYPHSEGWGWRPSIHMPREAARIFLRVTDVRVERLQDITEEQAQAEGVKGWMVATDRDWDKNPNHLIAFRHLWDSTIKKADRARYGWDASPWVWVIEFERCEKPEGD